MDSRRNYIVAILCGSLVCAFALSQRRTITLRNQSAEEVRATVILGSAHETVVIQPGARETVSLFAVVREGTLTIERVDAAGASARSHCGYETMLRPHDFVVLFRDGGERAVDYCEGINRGDSWISR